MRPTHYAVFSLFILGCSGGNFEVTGSADPEVTDTGTLTDDAESPQEVGKDSAPSGEDSGSAKDAPKTETIAPPDGAGKDCVNSSECNDADDCTDNVCTGGKCVFPNKPEGTFSCFGPAPVYKPGSCRTLSTGKMVCCAEGCWNGSTCEPGTSMTECSFGGNICRNCNTGNPCAIDSCTPTGCKTEPKPLGTGCPGGQCNKSSGLIPKCEPCGLKDQACCSGKDASTYAPSGCKGGTCVSGGCP